MGSLSSGVPILCRDGYGGLGAAHVDDEAVFDALDHDVLSDADRLTVGARLPELAVDEDEPGGIQRLAHDPDLAHELLLPGYGPAPPRLDDLGESEDHQERERPGDGERDPDRHLVAGPCRI